MCYLNMSFDTKLVLGPGSEPNLASVLQLRLLENRIKQLQCKLNWKHVYIKV